MKEVKLYQKKLILAAILAILVLLSALPVYGSAQAKVNTGTVSSAAIEVPAHPTYTVSFKESGLNQSMIWDVTLSGTVSSNGTYHNFTGLANGTYQFSVPALYSGNYGYIPTPSSGEVTLKGSNVTVPVSFYNQTVIPPTGKTFDLNFTVTNLPSVMPGISWSWSVTVTGTSVPFGPVTYGSQTSILDFLSSFVNGTYSYTISAPMGTSISPATGSVTFSGANISLNLSVSLQPHYEVNFYESGLPSTVSFTASVTDAPTNGLYYSARNTTSVSVHNYVGFSLTNQTYDFSIADSRPAAYVPETASGSITVSGSAINVNILFKVAPPTYSVLFELSNLPAVIPYSGWQWEVEINGSHYYSSNSSLVITGLPAGSYAFIAIGNGIAISTSSGTFTISGTSTTTVTLNVEPSWSASFEITSPSPMTGFPPYQVNVAYPVPYGSIPYTAHSSAGIATLQGLPDGTYSYTLSLSPGSSYSLTPTSGTFTINGGNVTIDITVSYLTYTVQFSEQGLLPTPVIEWGVVVDNGYYFNSTTPITGLYSIQPTPLYATLNLPPGTYMVQGFVINSLGQFFYQAPQQITVGSGSNLHVMQFSPGTSTASTGSLSLTDYGFIGGGVGIAIVGVIAGLLLSRRRNSGGSAP